MAYITACTTVQAMIELTLWLIHGRVTKYCCLSVWCGVVCVLGHSTTLSSHLCTVSRLWRWSAWAVHAELWLVGAYSTLAVGFSQRDSSTSWMDCAQGPLIAVSLHLCQSLACLSVSPVLYHSIVSLMCNTNQFTVIVRLRLLLLQPDTETTSTLTDTETYPVWPIISVRIIVASHHRSRDYMIHVQSRPGDLDLWPFDP